MSLKLPNVYSCSGMRQTQTVSKFSVRAGYLKWVFKLKAQCVFATAMVIPALSSLKVCSITPPLFRDVNFSCNTIIVELTHHQLSK